MPTSLTGLAAAVFVALVASGCAPSCEQTCNKLIRCDVADNLNQLECEQSCGQQLQQYDVEENDTLKRAFADHRRCIGSSSCEEIEDAECYDEDIFLF